MCVMCYDMLTHVYYANVLLTSGLCVQNGNGTPNVWSVLPNIGG